MLFRHLSASDLYNPHPSPLFSKLSIQGNNINNYIMKCMNLTFVYITLHALYLAIQDVK